jgi:uncharacterized protein
VPPVRVVFDTNVFIAAALKPAGHLAGWVFAPRGSRGFESFTSPSILSEVADKLEHKFEYAKGDVAKFLSKLQPSLTLVHPTRQISAVPNDPDDNKILECAVAAKAELIISADPHLYKLKRYEGIQILHPSSLKYIFPEQPKAA